MVPMKNILAFSCRKHRDPLAVLA